MDEFFLLVVLLAVIIFFISFMLLPMMTTFESKYIDLGNMICDEKGYGEFVSFDSDTKVIECKSIEDLEKYDGGYIKVVN